MVSAREFSRRDSRGGLPSASQSPLSSVGMVMPTSARSLAPPFPRKAVAASRAKPLQVRAFHARSRFVLFAVERLTPRGVVLKGGFLGDSFERCTELRASLVQREVSAKLTEGL